MVFRRLLPLFAVVAVGTLTGCPASNCSSASDCKDDEVCLAGTCALPDAGRALPDGGFAVLACESQPTLATGTLVGPSTDPATCQRPRGTSALAPARVRSLGTFSAGSEVSFNLPAQTYSFSILSQAVNATGPVDYQGATIENTVYPDFLTSPQNIRYFDSNDSPPADGSSQRIFYPLSPPSPVTGVMTLPNTTTALRQTAHDDGFPAGNWRFALVDIAYVCSLTAGCTGGSDAGTYELTLLTRPGIPPARGRMDLDVYLLTSDGLTRDTAAGNDRVQRMVQTFADLYRDQGVCLGQVTFFDVPQWARDRFGTGLSADQEGPCSDLSQLYTLSAPGRAAVPIFLVESLTTSGSQLVLGKDGTIPGPATVGGTVFSGAVVTAADLNSGDCSGPRNFSACGADRVAYIAGHEVGHFLGLFHVSESTGTFFDPLSDTPHCECQACVGATRASTCADKDPAPQTPTQVVPSDCNVTGASSVCSGGNNLMFWAFDPNRAQGTLSGQQGSVLRASPAVQ